MIICGDIDYSTVHSAYMLRERPDPVFLSSKGGDPAAAKAVADLVAMKPRPVVASGVCGSAALLILLAGETRLCTPSTTFVHHEPTIVDGDGIGYSADFRQAALSVSDLYTFICRRLAAATRCDFYWWFGLGRGSGEELSCDAAAECGLVYKVLTDLATEGRELLLKT